MTTEACQLGIFYFRLRTDTNLILKVVIYFNVYSYRNMMNFSRFTSITLFGFDVACITCIYL